MRDGQCFAPRPLSNMSSSEDTTHLIVFTGLIGIAFACVLMRQVAAVKLKIGDDMEMTSLVVRDMNLRTSDDSVRHLLCR